MKRIILLTLIMASTSVLAESCAAPHDLPLLTHYKSGVGYSLQGTDPQNDIYNPNAAESYLSGAITPLYNEFFPNINHYIGMNYDPSTFTNEQVATTLNAICTTTNVQFKLVQPAIEINTAQDIYNSIKKNTPYAQIIHSLVFRNNLFTIIVPPYWDPKNKYPTLINGFYGLNDSLINGAGPITMNTIGNLYNENHLGAIGILWNGGGAIGSRTMNDLAYRDLNDFMSLVIPTIGIDEDRIISHGGSRGGVTALNIASSSEITSFKVRYVYAQDMPNNIGYVASLIGTTMPELMFANDWSTGYVGSWNVNFVYPNNNTNLSGLSGIDAHVTALTGTSDPNRLNSHFNLDSSEKISNLLKRNTGVVLHIGTHDNIVPTIDKIRLMRAYNRAGVPTLTRIVYLGGHSGSEWYENTIMAGMRSLVNEMQHNGQKEQLIPAGKIELFLIASNKATATPYTAAISSKRLPLTLEVPRYINENANAYLLATGQPGHAYKLLFVNNGITYEVPFVLDGDGTYTYKINPWSIPDGRYELMGIEDITNGGAPLKLLKTTMPMTEHVVSDKVSGPVNQYGINTYSLVEQGYNGPNNEYMLYIGNNPSNTNNGVVEIIE